MNDAVPLHSDSHKSQILKDFAYLVKRGWRQVGPMARREVQMWNHQMLPYTYDGLITGEAMRVQKRYEKEDRVTVSVGGLKKIPCCGNRYWPKVDERWNFDFEARGREYLVCVLQVGHSVDHVAGAVGFEKKEWDDWRWENVGKDDPVELIRRGLGATPEKEQGMASAFEATVQLYKGDEFGVNGFTIVTDATTVESFEQALAKVIAEDWTEYDAGLLVPQVRAILNKLQGYKSEVQERRLLIAGQTMPNPVDLRFTTGPGLPSVELASNNGEAAAV